MIIFQWSGPKPNGLSIFDNSLFNNDYVIACVNYRNIFAMLQPKSISIAHI